MYNSEILGHTFWISEDGMFMSAPTFVDGTADLDNSIPVTDWESFSELSPYHFSHLMNVVQRCVLMRDKL